MIGTIRLATPVRRRLAAPIALLAILAVAFVLYRPAIGGPFLLDDLTNIPQTHLDRFSVGALLEIARSNESGPSGRPIPVVTFALNHLIGDGGVSAFKAVNLAIHLVNALLVYVLCRALLPLLPPPSGSPERTPSAPAIALLATAIWTLHPLQVSTVMYVVQRMTLLMTTFTLLSLIVYLKMRCAQIESGKPHVALAALVAALAALAFLSKENGILVVPYVVVLEVLVLRLRARDAERRRRLLKVFALAFLLASVAAVSLFAWNLDSLSRAYASREFGPGERLVTQAGVVLLYVRMILAPSLDDMTFYHDAVPLVRDLTVAACASVAAILAMASSVPLLARRAPLVALGVAMFLCSHLLESTIVPLELAFEHRNYFGTLWLWLPICWYAVELAGRRRTWLTPSVAASALLVFLSFQTFSRALEWSSDLTLNEIALENAPESRRARTNLVVSMARRGQFGEAVERLRLDPVGTPSDAYLPLVATQMLALEDRRDDELLAYTHRAIGLGTVTPEVERLLHSLYENQRTGANRSLGDGAVLALHAAALHNPRKSLDEAARTALRERHAALVADSRRTSGVPDAPTDER